MTAIRYSCSTIFRSHFWHHCLMTFSHIQLLYTFYFFLICDAVLFFERISKMYYSLIIESFIEFALFISNLLFIPSRFNRLQFADFKFFFFSFPSSASLQSFLSLLLNYRWLFPHSGNPYNTISTSVCMKSVPHVSNLAYVKAKCENRWVASHKRTYVR